MLHYVGFNITIGALFLSPAYNGCVAGDRSSLNPALDIGQVEGGFMFGLGYYMMEDMLYSGELGGDLFSDSATRYKVPMFGDVPRKFDVEILKYGPDEENAGTGVFGTKGIGEANIGLALSVYYGVKDALRRAAGGSERVELGFPATPDRVRLAWDKINGDE
jgi:xanthine dehydrogenase molybdopterin-binding subunit B